MSKPPTPADVAPMIRLHTTTHHDAIIDIARTDANKSASRARTIQTDHLCLASGKRVYDSEAEAGLDLDRYAAKALSGRSNHRQPITMYRCRHCGGIHLASHGGDQVMMERWRADPRHQEPQDYTQDRFARALADLHAGATVASSIDPEVAAVLSAMAGEDQ